jgi:hypothetical protein
MAEVNSEKQLKAFEQQLIQVMYCVVGQEMVTEHPNVM